MKDIPIPRRLEKRPRYKGLPIPWIALIREDGQPDFRVTDAEKRHQVMLNRWCQLCGEPLGKWQFFTGGTEAAKHNQFFEPACHLDCLVYAMQVCPFIVGKMEHADLEKVQKANPDVTVAIDETYTTVRNPNWVIVKANGWRYLRTQGGTILIQPWVVKQSETLHPETMDAAEWQRVQASLM